MINNTITSALGSYAVRSLNQTSAKKPERQTAPVKSADVFTLKTQEYDDKIAYEAADIASGVRQADDTSLANQIASRIKNGAYAVPAEEIAKAILGI
jgi:anti-sigma28 factor (negative regulator of flagellin synthesis)